MKHFYTHDSVSNDTEVHTSYQPTIRAVVEFTFNSLLFYVLCLGQIEIQSQMKESVNVSEKMRCYLTIALAFLKLLLHIFFVNVVFFISVSSMLKLFKKSATNASKCAYFRAFNLTLLVPDP